MEERARGMEKWDEVFQSMGSSLLLASPLQEMLQCYLQQ